MSTSPNPVFGRYRIPDAWKLLALSVVVLAGITAYGVAFLHHQLWGHRLIAPLSYLLTLAFFSAVPMTVIAESGLRRWWSTQKSFVPWDKVNEVEARPVSRKNRYPVHAQQTNGDSIVLIGVPASAVPELNRLVTESKQTA